MNLVSYWQKICVPFIKARFQPQSELGASLVEYALLLALIAVVCIGAVTLIGNNANTYMSSAGNAIK